MIYQAELAIIKENLLNGITLIPSLEHTKKPSAILSLWCFEIVQDNFRGL